MCYRPRIPVLEGFPVPSPASESRLEADKSRFAPEDIAFALAWEVYAPGLGGWTVQIDEDESGSEYLLVDPPLVFGDGFTVRPDPAGATITWHDGTARAANLREAMLKICPLCPDALAAVELLAVAPGPEF